MNQTIGFGTLVDGSRAAKQECLTLARENLEQAKVILEKGPHPTSAVLQLELALMQIGNAVALIFDRSIEGKSDPQGLHNAAAMAMVAYCRDEHPRLLDDARFASAFVRGRNDYAYRHDRIAEADLRRLFIAASKLYNGLSKAIIDQEHRPLI